ncbi:MAG: PrsW family intramembrane metalloprotease [Flammeovirgaceae bacterium]
MHIFFVLALALAPCAAIVLYIYWKDEHEREPIGLLVKSFFMGVLSTIITLVISWPINEIIPINHTSLSQEAVHAFVLVAFIEEFSKFIFVRWVLFPNPNFNEPYDGIVYAVTVSLGFAGLENILYVWNGGVEVAVARMFTAVPAHATFGALMGYFLGITKFQHKKEHYSWYALGVATLFHGVYDYFWFISYVPGIWVGAIASLTMGIILSKSAIRIHQKNSPFKPHP